MITEQSINFSEDPQKYTPLNLVKEKSRIHPTTSSTKIILQYHLPEGVIVGEGHKKFVLNEFLDEEGKLKSQNNHQRIRSTKKLETIAKETSATNTKSKSTYVKKSDAPNYLTLKELVQREGLRKWTHEKDILTLQGVPADFMMGKRSGLRINPAYVDNDKKLILSIDFTPLKSRNNNVDGTKVKYIRESDKDRVTLNHLINQMGLYKLTTKNQILGIPGVPNDLFIGSTHKSKINPVYLDKDKNLNINIDFSSLKPKQVKQYKNKGQSTYITPESHNIVEGDIQREERKDHTVEKVELKHKEVSPKGKYFNGADLLNELSNIVDALKPILAEKSDEQRVDTPIEDTAPYKQLAQKVQILESELEKSQREYQNLEGAYKKVLKSSQDSPSKQADTNLTDRVTKAEHDTLRKKFDSAVEINANLLAELEQLKYSKRHNVPGPIDMTKMLSDAEKVVLLIQERAIKYGNLSVALEDNGMVISSMSGTDRVIHYSTVQKDTLDIPPTDNSKKYDSLFLKHKDTVETILNTFLKVKMPCLESIDKDIARVVYNKEVCLDPRVDKEKIYIAEILFETELGAALISHGTDGTRANPIILRAVTNMFKYHREKEFIKLLDKYISGEPAETNSEI